MLNEEVLHVYICAPPEHSTTCSGCASSTRRPWLQGTRAPCLQYRMLYSARTARYAPPSHAPVASMHTYIRRPRAHAYAACGEDHIARYGTAGLVERYCVPGGWAARMLMRSAARARRACAYIKVRPARARCAHAYKGPLCPRPLAHNGSRARRDPRLTHAYETNTHA